MSTNVDAHIKKLRMYIVWLLVMATICLLGCILTACYGLTTLFSSPINSLPIFGMSFGCGLLVLVLVNQYLILKSKIDDLEIELKQ